MARPDRVQRPTPARTKPNRSWATAVSAAPPGAPIGPEVQNANRVVEEYLRAGEASARQFQNMLGGGARNGTPDIAQGMVRAASDMMSFWVELMTRSVGGMTPGDPTRSTNPQHDAPRSDGSRERVRVSVAVDSRRPATVSVDVRPDARSATLRLERLHRRGTGRGVLLSGAAIETSSGDEPITIRLRVAPEQPAGVYHGVIVDEETSRPVGTITVELQASCPSAGAKSAK
jgi:hypothetical protein